jgi:divalent metal cation (Fe/Co/Zn/Cd) transporter
VGEIRTTIMVALAANVVLAAAKLGAGVVTGSAAMLAESAHPIADTVDQLVLVGSLRWAAGRPDDKHPSGRGKERFF